MPEAVFFISGTGTGVGKTLVSALLIRFFLNQGQAAAYYKPVESGALPGPDGPVAGDLAFVRTINPELVMGEDACNSYLFRLPASPHLAAEEESRRVDETIIKTRFHALRKRYAPLLVEGAGGLLVPLRRDLVQIDLISALSCPVILVADAGLGTLNHTLLSLEALRRRRIRVAGLVLNRYPHNDDLIARDNRETLRQMADCPLLGVVPVLDNVHKLPDPATLFAVDLLR